MTPAQKAARSIKQATIRAITKNLSYCLRLTNGQLKAAAKTMYDRQKAGNV